ncbi:MAG: alpha/beta fold hydrolase [Acidimicrobiales bacterium]
MRPSAAPNVAATVLSLPDGREVAFAEYGDPAGAPVFAFHGTPGSRLQLAPADAAAREARVRLIVPDRPGYGHSSFVARPRLVDWPFDVLAIADHLGLDRFAVLGVSGGGPHALACAASGSSRVAAAAVISSPCPYPDGTEAVRGPRRWLARLLGVPGLIWLVATIVVAVSRRLPRAAFDVARRCMPEADRRVVDGVGFREWFIDSSRRASSTTARAMAQDLALFSSEWRIGLDAVDIPVTIWHGTDDRLVEPSSADVLGAILPHATLRWCPDEGHLLFADRVADILDELVAAWPEGLERATAHAGTSGPVVDGGSAAP